MKTNFKKNRGIAPKKRFSLSPTAIFCALALSLPTVAQAGALDSLMEGVYTNTTDSGAFKSQKMGHYQGGSFYARFPTKSINIAMFDPPRIQAGCGGVDLFGGSFSFISGDEIVQILRSIGQNALGLLFQMGIQAISQPLSTLLSHWSDKLQQMNQALRNTCAAANKLVSIVTDGPAQDENKTRKGMMDTFDGFWSDSMEAFNKGKAQARENNLWPKLASWGKRSDRQNITSDKAKAENEAANDPKNGNLTWKALTNSKSYKRVGDVLNNKGFEREIKELIINIGGTQINDQFTKESSSPQANNKCSTDTSIPCEGNNIDVFTTQFLTATDLMEIGPNDRDILTCKDGDGINHSTDDLDQDMACVTMEFTKLSNTFKGAAYYVNRALFGSNSTKKLDGDEIKAQINNSRGLIGKGLSSNSAMPSPEELSILENTSIPFLAHLFYLQVEPQEQMNAIILVYDVMVRKYAYMISMNLLHAAQGAFIGGSTKVYANKPTNYDENLAKFQRSFADLELTPEKEIELNNTLNIMRMNVEKNAQSKAVSNRVTSNNNTK